MSKLDPKTVVHKATPAVAPEPEVLVQTPPEEYDLVAEEAKKKWKRRPRPVDVVDLTSPNFQAMVTDTIQAKTTTEREPGQAQEAADPTPIESKPEIVVTKSTRLDQPISGASDGSGSTTIDNFPYKLPASAQEWCSPSILPPIDYEKCADRTIVNSVPLYGGLTNSLKIVLLGAILSFEENRCFYVDESLSELLRRTDQSQSLDSFLNRYLEPIGLQSSSPVYKALTPETTRERNWREVWDWRHNRRVEGQNDTMPGLDYPLIEGHTLKRIIMRRLFRLQPQIRDLTCKGLEGHGLQEEFMTFSVRQGDKMKEEHFSYATMPQYIAAAEEAIPKYFGGKVPTIFVATDDCLVMEEFRTLRPNWRFVSECDSIQNRDHGFALVDMAQWSKDATDAHFLKFFVELYAMAT